MWSSTFSSASVGLRGQRSQQLAIVVGERLPRRATVISPWTGVRRARSGQRDRGDDEPFAGRLAEPPHPSAARSASWTRSLEPPSERRRRATVSLERLVGSRPDAEAAALGLHGVDGGPQRQLQQRGPVEVRGERLPDAPDRLAQPRSLLRELVEPLRELADMLLNSSPSAANSSSPSVGTARRSRRPPSRRAAWRKRPSWPCSAARRQHREGEGQQQEAGDERGGEEPAGADRGGGRREAGEDRDLTGEPPKPGQMQVTTPIVDAADGHEPCPGRRACARAVEPRRASVPAPWRTTTPTPGPRAHARTVGGASARRPSRSWLGAPAAARGDRRYPGADRAAIADVGDDRDDPWRRPPAPAPAARAIVAACAGEGRPTPWLSTTRPAPAASAAATRAR